MAAGEQRGRRQEQTPGKRRAAAGEATPRATPRSRATSARARQVARIDRPAVAPCPDHEALRALPPAAARERVNTYLHEVMSAREADDFEALAYCWELHLVELEQLCLLRSVDLSKRKLGHYRAVLRKGGGFPPLIGLGSDGKDVTHGVLLCDGYHRAVAMRDVGMHFVWMWLAVDAWEPAAAAPVLTGSREG